MQIGGWGRSVVSDIHNEKTAKKRELLKEKKMKSRSLLDAPQDIKNYIF